MKKLLVMLCGVMLLVVSGCCSLGQCKITMEKNAVLLDVRTPEEHKTGYLEGAVLLPPAVPVTINLNDCKLENVKVYLLDEEHDLTETNCTCNADGSVTFNMKGNSVVYVEG